MNRIRTFLVLAAGALFAAPSAMGQGAQSGPQAAGIAAGQSVAGELTQSDTQRRSGKYEDVYVLEGRRGQPRPARPRLRRLRSLSGGDRPARAST